MSKSAKDILASIKQLFTAAPENFESVKAADGTVLTYDKLEVGGKCMVGEGPAPAQDYTLEDGTKITIGEGGMITAMTPPVKEDDMTTPEGMRKAYDKFATGTPEERVANLETLCRAMMEYCFGWQLREAQAKQTTDEAIKVYKTLTDTTATTVQQQQKMMAHFIELAEALTGAPAGPTAPVAPIKKFSFSKGEDKKQAAISKFTEAMKRLNEEKKTATA